MDTVVDFHSHILPGIDDGSSSVEESVVMLQKEASHGIEHVIATPHFYAHRDNLSMFLENRERSEQLLREAMAKYSGLPQLSVGAEVYFFTGISESREIPSLAISSTSCIMVEMPRPPWTDAMYRELEQLHTKRGLIPIVAHVDRYITRFRTFGISKKLAELPVFVQANAEFFLNRQTKSIALKMLRNGKIHLLGSDCHNLNSRIPNLGEAVKLISKRLGMPTIERINQYEQSILHGKELIFPTHVCE